HVSGGQMPKSSASKSKLVAEAAERVQVRLSPTEVRDVAEDIEWRKISELTLEGYAESLETGARGTPARLSPHEAAAVVAAYEQVKDERRVVDFEDILLATAGM